MKTGPFEDLLPDLKRAKALAARKGVGYQTYIRSVLHEALQQKA
jgi:predicted DNA binding CopG/RHH family protein